MASWLDAIERRAREAIGIPDEPKPVRIVTAREPKREIKSVWFQTRSPRDGDAGEVEAGYYSVADGVVKMHDEKGIPTGKSQGLGSNDDPHMVAGRLARAAWDKARGLSNFNRPLNYQPSGNA